MAEVFARTPKENHPKITLKYFVLTVGICVLLIGGYSTWASISTALTHREEVRQAVLAKLPAPETAKFSDVVYTLEGGHGEVESTSGIGKTVRAHFEAKKDDFEWDVSLTEK